MFKNTLFLSALVSFFLVLSAFPVQASFVPESCVVEDWCVLKATDCRLMSVSRPTGLYQAVTQYSVVRRAQALCPDYLGQYLSQWSRMQITGPVEPVSFRGTIEVSEEQAVTQALGLCQAYRSDWVSAAPVCSP